MAAHTDQRICHRFSHETPIWLTHLNDKNWCEAHSLNHCTEGMCFKSDSAFHLGAALLIRRCGQAVDGSCDSVSQGLRTMTMGEVRWCQEIPGTAPSAYEIGIKYFSPVY